MAEFVNDKRLYLLYQPPWQSSTGFLEELKVHLKLNEANNGDVGYQTGLDEAVLLDKQDINSNTSRKEQNIEANTKARENYPTCMLTSGVDKMIYNQLNM